MRVKFQLLFSTLFLLGIFFFSTKNALAANYTMTASSYHLNTSTNAITFDAINPTANFDQVDRIDIVITTSQFVLSGSNVIYRTNWPNNPNCTFGSATEYYCNNNILSQINPLSSSHSLYICLYGEFDNNTYCSQELSYSDFTATRYPITLSNYHLDPSTGSFTFVATTSSPVTFDQVDRMDHALTNTPYIITGPNVSYRQDWPNNPGCSFWSTTEYHCTNDSMSKLGTPASTVYMCLYGEFDNNMYCSQPISYFDLVTLIPPITYFNANDGTSFSRALTPFSSGVATQTKNSDGTVTISVNNAPGYADSGFDIYEGTLANLPNFSVNGSGGQFGLNLWFDTNNDGEYFAWNSNNILTSLNGDTYGLGPSSSNGSIAVDGTSQFFMMSDGKNHTLADLKNGLVNGISSSTRVAVWVGVNVNSGSTSSTINSISGL